MGAPPYRFGLRIVENFEHCIMPKYSRGGATDELMLHRKFGKASPSVHDPFHLLDRFPTSFCFLIISIALLRAALIKFPRCEEDYSPPPCLFQRKGERFKEKQRFFSEYAAIY